MLSNKTQSWPMLRRLGTATQTRKSQSQTQSRFHSASLPVMNTADMHVTSKPSPFHVRWVYGLNWRAGVVNLKRAVPWNTHLLYAAGNCAVLYDWTSHRQSILQGHKHMVTSIASSSDGKVLVTADSGPEDAVIVWDSRDLFPLRTIFSPHGNVKLNKVAISADAKYILTLGCRDTATVHWWIWSNGQDTPEASCSFSVGRGVVVDACFDPTHSRQFAVLTKYQLWIGLSAKKIIKEGGVTKETDEYELKIRPVEKEFTAECGRYSCYTFVEESSRVLVATSRGRVLVFSNGVESADTGVDYHRLKYIKTLEVDNRAINVIKSIDGVIVTGNSGGEVRFYDDDMRLMYVMSERYGIIRRISFDLFPRNVNIMNPKCKKVCRCWDKTPSAGEKLLRHTLPHDYCAHPQPFIARNFFVSTQDQGIKYVEFLTGKALTIVDCNTSPATAVTVHPEILLMCVTFADGGVDLYDCGRRRLARRMDLRDHYTTVTPPDEDSIRGDSDVQRPRLCGTSLEYSPSGLHLACGLDSGKLIFLHPSLLNIIEEKQHTSYAITQIRYTSDSTVLVTADKGRNVCVYKYENNNWHYLAKLRAHYKDITSLFFMPRTSENEKFKLVSLGLDRLLVVYDLGDDVTILRNNRVEQSALPLAGIPWPTPAGLDPEEYNVDLSLVLIANDQFKYKVVNISSGACLSTVLGPRYEHPVRGLHLASRAVDGTHQQYLVFLTKHVIGLQKMPLDGNPWKYVAVLGHPLQVLVSCYHDLSGALFTIGAKDCCVTQWETVYKAVETTTKRGGVGLEPYYCLFDGGRPGWLFQEIRDLFYYVQVLCQGTFTPVARRVRDHIPVDALPDLMRTLGFFLTEHEGENLITEAKYKVHQREPTLEVDFEEFVMLYLNHRPAFGDTYNQVRAAFRHFAEVHAAPAMERDRLIDILSKHGECFSPDLSWYLLSVLCEMCSEIRCNMIEEDFSFLPEILSLKDFITSILGVQEVECSDQSIKESIYSAATTSTITGSFEPYEARP